MARGSLKRTNLLAKIKESLAQPISRGRLYVLIALMVGGTTLFTVDTSFEPKLPIEQVTSTLVKIAGAKGYGSGVVFKSDANGSLILTNKHVCMINDGRAMSLIFNSIEEFTIFDAEQIDSKKSFEAQVLEMDSNTDLCVLHTSLKNLPAAKFAKTIPAQGDMLFNVSNPLGIKGYVSSGRVGRDMFIYEMLYRQTSVPVYPGSSGSAVFNVKGEVAGLISLGIPGTVISFIVPLEHIRLFTKRYL